MLPTAVLAEYLVGLPGSEQGRHKRILERHFSMPAFDVPAAYLAAQLQADTEMLKQMSREHGVNRQALRTDAMIVAIAIVQKATKIITYDTAHFKKLAKGQIPVEDLPDVLDQRTMFET